MQLRARQFMGGFFIAVILIGAVCGFMVVDLSTDRYMPGKVGPMLAVTSISDGGLDFSYMGNAYYLDPAVAGEALTTAGEFSGLIPAPIRMAAGAAELLSHWLNQQLEND